MSEMFGQRKAKPVEGIVKSFGEDLPIALRPLSALEVDHLRNAYPPPTPPREVVDGETRINDKDADYMRQLNAWMEQFFTLKICRMIGSEAFGTEDLLQQVTLLKADFTEREFVDLVILANKIGAGEITAADMEAAKGRLLPFESSQQESA